MLKLRTVAARRQPLTRAFSQKLKVDNPYSGDTVCEIPLLSVREAEQAIDRSRKAQKHWAAVPLSKRIDACNQFIGAFQAAEKSIAADISRQMGKPLKQALGEVQGAIFRAKSMIEFAPTALADETLPAKEKFVRKLVREPVGVVVVLAPWNYPLLTAVNSVIPAVLSGNSVLLKHSPRTPLCANHFQEAFLKAGVPEGLVTALQIDLDVTNAVITHPGVDFVQFTGSVEGGRSVYSKVAAKRFIDVGLELGGKDPAYVAEDADIDHAVENIVDGALYNSGQSCCAVERAYIHKSLYDSFLQKAIPWFKSQKMGDPMSAETSMGPMAQPHSPPFLQKQVDEALKMGAKVLIGGKTTGDATGKGRFFQPTLLADCNHKMSVMTEESFGPLLAVAPVDSDEHAIQLMNDSKYGLTASIWTKNMDRAAKMAPRVEAGTVFANRCDYLDPQLAWTGVKDSGKGISLSHLGFNAVTRVKSIHFRQV